MNTTAPTLPVIRKLLKAAGLVSSKVDVSTQVRGYRTTVRQGFSLKNETDYTRVRDYPTGPERKAHVPTGRVLLSIDLSSWHGDTALADRDLAKATAVLTEAGFTVANYADHTLVIS